MEPGAHICRTWFSVTDRFRLTLFLHLPDASTHWDLGHTHYNTQNRHLSCIRILRAQSEVEYQWSYDVWIRKLDLIPKLCR